MNPLQKIPKRKILVIDTETTGTGHLAEILQFSAIDGHGTTLMNQYIRPAHTTSWPEAEAVNGITPAFAQKQPFLSEINGRIENLLTNASLIIGYNLPFDLQMLSQNNIRLPFTRKYLDLMIPFSRRYGEWNEFFQDWKWQKLKTCAEFYGYKENSWHDSLADVKGTLYSFFAMAEEGSLSEKDIY